VLREHLSDIRIITSMFFSAYSSDPAMAGSGREIDSLFADSNKGDKSGEGKP
jgi:hypothetical protein